MKNSDTHEISNLLGISYELWLLKAKEVLQRPDSPLSVKDGVWKVSRRPELLSLLGPRILDQNLDAFRAAAIRVLKERDPAFELPTEERYAASVYGKVQSYSSSFRMGLAEGLALVSNNPGAFPNASHGKAEAVGILAVREILADADWVTWGSLNNLLPILAEAAPEEFLAVVDAALQRDPCPFDELFAQERGAFMGDNYLTGLLWALEGLAWDSELLVRVCVLLAEMASHDPGGNWANRPANSLATILLPWLPQTLGSIEKRKVAVQTVLAEQPEVGWNLLLQFLPGHHQVSSGSHKPEWRKSIPDDWGKGVSHKEYWDQVSAYSELAVQTAGTDPDKLAQLISQIDLLVRPSFNELLNRLKSDDITGLPEEQRLPIWEHLVDFVRKHRWFADADWALPDDLIASIEAVADQLAPINAFNLYQDLFTGAARGRYEKIQDWEEHSKQLHARRETAIQEILNNGGISEVLRFAEAVKSPQQVGEALASIADDSIDQYLLPSFLNHANGKFRDLLGTYIWWRCNAVGWEWCDELDKSGWTLEEKGKLLASLPFAKETWDRALDWLQVGEREYWTRASLNSCQAGGDIRIAIEKLIQYGRPHAALRCLYTMRIADPELPLDKKQCVRALLAAPSSSEPSHMMDTYQIVELIKFLQSESSVSKDDLFNIEWAYLSLLDDYMGATPQLLESGLANEPEFFYEVIRLIYRSKNEGLPSKELSKDTQAIASNAFRLLAGWRTPPGTQADSSFSGESFSKWLDSTKAICRESGHLDPALIKVGEVLIYAPPDANGLWIDVTVASALNDRDHELMRRGFSTALYNSRGVHTVVSTGKPEKELAEKYRRKAEDVENAGFQRLATTLRELAAGYDREAERVIAEHENRSAGGDW